MYAVVETDGKQYRVEPGTVIQVDSMDAEIGTLVTIEKVLMVSGNDNPVIGAPHVTSAKVVAEVTGHGRDQKVLIVKKKRRKSYRRVNGHRQGYTALAIKEIVV
ncbi:MAG: 50S ribosomal protein L21 [Nitrospirae bacterium]|nr:50S ribosomal protein L21 [Nitrospirota bacterium]